MSCTQRLADLVAPFRKTSMAALLVLLVIAVFGVPFFIVSNSTMGRIAQDLLLSLILLTGVVTATERPKAAVLITPVALVAIAVRGASWVLPADITLAMRDETTLLAAGLLSVTLAMSVFAPGKVTFDRIDGAIALYILVGVIWAEAYQLVSILVPKAFHSATLDQNSESVSTWIYFSFTTLTTAGYGDIVPVAPQARSLANLEGLIGQLYPAIVLARLVSLHSTGGSAGKDKP
jgi:4-amino-4-deoxy-L-arabinose transferase-like glycosyltransferase